MSSLLQHGQMEVLIALGGVVTVVSGKGRDKGGGGVVAGAYPSGPRVMGEVRGD